MIFLKKFSAAAVLTAAMTIISGCSLKKTDKAEDVSAAVSTTVTTEEAVSEEASAEAVSTEKATEAPKKADDKLKAETGKYVYDLAHLMTDEQKKACEDYISTLYSKYMLNAAVVTSSDLGGKAPYTYAAEAYFTIYGGEGSGLLFLINNDTNEDHLYKTGTCTHTIGAEEEKTALYTATREIVSGEYDLAVKDMLGLGEVSSERVFDEAEAFSLTEIAATDKLLEGASVPAALAAVRNESTSGKDAAALAKELFGRHFTDGKGIMIVLDVTNKKAAAYSPEHLPAGAEAGLKKANEYAAKSDWAKAAEEAAKSLSGNSESSGAEKTTASAAETAKNNQ